MKKTRFTFLIVILGVMVVFFSTLTPLATRAGFPSGVEPPEEGYEDLPVVEETGLGDQDPVRLTVNIIAWALSLLGLIFLCLIIYGGFAWLFAGGNEDKIKKAKGIIKNATIGLFIVVASYGIVNYIMWNLWAKTHF